jgi:hypothetical protein
VKVGKAWHDWVESLRCLTNGVYPPRCDA